MGEFAKAKNIDKELCEQLKSPISICALLILISFCFFTRVVHAQSPRPHYELKINFDVDNHLVDTVEKVKFVNTTQVELSELHFKIYANQHFRPKDKRKIGFLQNYFKANMFPDGIKNQEFNLKSIKSDNSILNFKIEDPYLTTLVVYLKRPLGISEEIELTIDFSFKLPHAFGFYGYYQGINYLGHWYPVLAVHKDGKWHDNPFGVNHQPFFSDAAYYDVDLTLDKNQNVAHSGEAIETNLNPDGTKTLKIKTDLVRDFTFASSDLYKVLSAETKGVNIKLYYLPKDEECAKEGLKDAVSAMNYYIGKFGPYPYPSFSIAETHIGWLGNEFSNMIFIDSRGFNLPDILYRHLDFLICHEMAHQWWYLQVGSDQFSEAWLDEAFAAYSETMYLEDKYGEQDNYLELPHWAQFLPNTSFKEGRTQRYLAQAKSNSDEEILKPIDKFNNIENLFVSTYDKGAWVLDMLRYVVTDEIFFKIMRTYLEQYKFKIADVEDFIRVAEEISQKDLRWFFEEWLTTTKKCDYALSGVRQRSELEGWLTHFTLERKGKIVMPVEVKIITQNGEEIVKNWEGREESKEFELMTKERVAKILIDPDRKLLDYQLQNNYWPIKKELTLAPWYFMIYDFPIFHSSDAYSIVAGPTFDLTASGFRISGRRVSDYMSYLDCRYDFHRKEFRNLLGHRIEHSFGRRNSLDFEVSFDRSVDSAEKFTKGKILFNKRLGPTIYSVDKILNDVSFYVERNREKEEDKITINRTKIGLDYNFDSRIINWNPIRGAKLYFNIGQGVKLMGSDTDFTKGEIDLRLYQNLWQKNHILANRLNIGLSTGDISGEEIFKLGGTDTLRGFGTDEFETRNKFLYNLEYRFPLIKEKEESFLRDFFTFNGLSGVVFFDAGLPWERQIETDNVKCDLGVGLRFEVTLLGFLEKTSNRVDVAFPLDGSKDLHLWFQITQAF